MGPTAVIATFLLAAIPSVAQAMVIGGPLIRDGLQIVPAYQTGVTLDRSPVVVGEGPNTIELEADVRATHDDAYGFGEGAFIPYLSISYVMTRDDLRTFRKSGLLYPTVSRLGPHYGAQVELAGAGSYRLTLLVSPPASHGVVRHTDKTGGVPDWWKPITANWTFNYPSTPSASK